jgi:hypothetical protein
VLHRVSQRVALAEGLSVGEVLVPDTVPDDLAAGLGTPGISEGVTLRSGGLVSAA